MKHQFKDIQVGLFSLILTMIIWISLHVQVQVSEQ